MSTPVLTGSNARCYTGGMTNTKGTQDIHQVFEIAATNAKQYWQNTNVGYVTKVFLGDSEYRVCVREFTSGKFAGQVWASIDFVTGHGGTEFVDAVWASDEMADKLLAVAKAATS